MVKIPENPYRKELATAYITEYMGKPGDEDIKKAVNGDDDDISLDYYIGAEKMINNAIMLFREMDQK